MTDPLDDDNGWADLARELGVDNSTPTHVPSPEPQSAHASVAETWDDESTSVEGEEVAEFADSDEASSEESGDEFEDSEDGEGASDTDTDSESELPESPSDESEPGGKKKRRRRRRRRKKGGAESPESVAGAEAAESEECDEEESESDSEEWSEAEAEPVEEVAAETPYDVIANWNVPSWEEIVNGLYRPQHH